MITSSDVRNEYTASASQTVFNYTYKIYASTDLNVYVTPAGQACSAADLTTAYTVAGVGVEGGGSITLSTPTGSGDLVTIVSAIPANRTTDYQNNGDFRPDTINDDLDRSISITKQAIDLAQRSLTFSECQQGVSSLTLPAPVAQNYVRWKSDLSGLENIDIAASGNPTDASVVSLTIDATTTNVSAYLNSEKFDSVASMVAAALVSGRTSYTTSYHGGWAATTAGPVGGALYTIVTAAQFAVMFSRPVDNIIHHTLANGNVAVLQHQPGELNILQCGADRKGVTPCTTIVQACADWLAEETTTNRAGTIIIPDGTYLKGKNTLKRCSVLANNGCIITADIANMTSGDYVWETVNTFGDDEFIKGGIINCGAVSNGIGGIWLRDWGWSVSHIRINDASTGILSTNFSNSIGRAWIQGCGISIDLAGDGGSGAHDNHVERVFSLLSETADIIIRSGTNPRVINSVFQQQRGDYSIFLDATIDDIGCPQILNNYFESDTPAISTLLYYVDIAAGVTSPRVEGNTFVGRVGSVATAIRTAAASPISIKGNQAAQVTTFIVSSSSFGGVIEQNTATQNVTNFITGSSRDKYRYKSNNGFVANKKGSATILSGTTTIAVTHGLSLTPDSSSINIVQTSNSSNDPGNIYITGIGATTFTVSSRQNPGASGFIFDWSARVGGSD